jgi:HK97 family phage major capsid protein
MKTLSLVELNGRMNKAVTRLDELRTKDGTDEGLTDDENREVDALIAEVNDLGPQIVRAKSLDAISSDHKSGQESNGRVSGVIARGERKVEDTHEPRERRSLPRQFFDSDEMETLRARQGQGVASFDIKSFWNMRSAAADDMEQRAPVHTGTLPADYLEPQRIPGIQRGSDLFGSLRDVLNVGVTDKESLVFFRELVFTNNAAFVGEATVSGDTSGTKPESAITFEQDIATIGTIAHHLPITRQLLWSAPEFESYINGRLIDGLRLEENNQLLNGDGVGENPSGLLNTAGIQYLDNTATTGYWAVNPVDGVGTSNENFERLLRARTLVSTVGRARANFVVLNPVDHEKFLATKDGQRQYFGQGPFNGAPVSTIWGLRVVENENIAAGNALVGDGRQATIWDRMQATVSTGTIDKQFIRNMLTLLAEERVGLAVDRPQGFAHVELAA